ncbi:MAG: glutamine amidotransferase [Syntrophomonadaceae bacterium]|nr:glutamine amidotransferase [Syntrophomonadaceae bacterium]
MLLMGGGSQREQELVYNDLSPKADSLKTCIENGLPALFIGGAYQLLGTSYQLSTGQIKPRLGIFNFYTKTMDNRLTGNILIKTNIDNNSVDVVGFENHVGRIYILDEDLEPFGTVVKGYGNNGEDSTEGIKYKNLIGTHLHGPILPKNPAVADFFINKILERKNIKKNTKLNDELELFAHNQIKKRLLAK